MATLLAFALGFPLAYFIAFRSGRYKSLMLFLVIAPFFTSFILRTIAWRQILADDGPIASTLNYFHLLPGGHITETWVAVVAGLTYNFLPFMVLPLYANLVKMDFRLLEAARDLGATPWQAFWRITVPLSKSGIIAGSMLVFIPCVGEFVIPELLGGPETLMIGHVLWDEFFTNNDWPMASSVTVVVILLILVPMAIFNKYKAEQEARA